jgi:hypothetical protein
MKKLPSALVLIAFASFLHSANAADGMRDEKIEKLFPVRPGGTLIFDADLANVEIVPGDSDKIRIEYIREFKVNTSQEANDLRQRLTIGMGHTDITGTANDVNTVKVTVRFADDRQQRDRNKVRLDFRIAMPRKFNLDLRTVGSAKVDDLDGSAKFSILGGSLKLGNVTGPVTATTKGGSLSLGDVGGDLEARASGGSVKAGHIKGKALVVAEGGSVSVEEAAEIPEATANGGSVKVSISKQPSTDSKITANAGSIDLRLPASAAVTIDASCTAGRVSSDFEIDKNQRDDPTRLKGNINGGGQVLKLRATAGSIHLRK